MESLEKEIECFKNENVNIIVLDGDEITAKEVFDNNQYQNILNRLDVNTIEEVDQNISQNNGSVKKETETFSSNKKNTLKQRISFVQGQRITLENAIMDVQRVIEMFISKKRKLFLYH